MSDEKRKSERRTPKKRRVRKIPISGEDRRAEFDRRKEERRKAEEAKETS